MALIKVQVSQQRVRQLWRAAGYLLVAAVIVLSVVPDAPTPDRRGADKFGHLLAYGTLMLWFAQIHLRSQWLRLGLLFTAMGVALEYAQGALGARTFSPADMLANAAGVAIGWIAARAGCDSLLVRMERWLGAVKT